VGYFKDQIRRGRCSTEKHLLEHRAVPSAMAEWVSANNRPPKRDRNKYIRFATDDHDPDSLQSTGIFQAAYQLTRSPAPSSPEVKELIEVIEWFGANLPSPKQVAPAAIFWFKSDSRELINPIWCIVKALRRYGREVRMMRMEKPGRIICEDDFQIAAIAKWRL
jgi:hypothetical protein